LNGNNSVIFGWIHSKFDADTENEAPKLVSMAKLICHKIHNWANIGANAPNLIQMLKKGSGSQLYCQKSKMVAAWR